VADSSQVVASGEVRATNLRAKSGVPVFRADLMLPSGVTSRRNSYPEYCFRVLARTSGSEQGFTG
jgi:hypothetical protein